MVDALFLATVSLSLGILLTLGEGLRRRHVPAVVNAAVSAGAVLLAFGSGLAVGVGPAELVGSGLVVWVALAGFVHSIGMLGPYDRIWWWDLLAHALSAALLTALLYAAVLVVGAGATADAAGGAVIAMTVAVALAAGVFWELLELLARDVADRYDIDPVLVHYGWRDTAVDLVVDLGAAVVVVVLDIRVFVWFTGRAPDWTRTLVVGFAGGVVLGSLVMGSWLLLTRVNRW